MILIFSWFFKEKSFQFLFVFFLEFNEALGRMTHFGCEPSYNFLPQEFGLPETLTALRKIVRNCL